MPKMDTLRPIPLNGGLVNRNLTTFHPRTKAINERLGIGRLKVERRTNLQESEGQLTYIKPGDIGVFSAGHDGQRRVGKKRWLVGTGVSYHYILPISCAQQPYYRDFPKPCHPERPDAISPR